MKLFIDSANVGEIRKAAESGFLDGVTTNPTLIAKEGRSFDSVVKEILDICKGDVSIECTTDKFDEMIEEGKRISKMGPNAVVKCQMTRDGLRAARELSRMGIKTNVTLCFSPLQAILAAKAGATYVSPFIGRLDDAGHIGMELIRQIVQIYRNYGYKTEVLAASIRHPTHLVEAALAGAHVSTMPYAVFDKMVYHPLTDKGLAQFFEDVKKYRNFK